MEALPSFTWTSHRCTSPQGSINEHAGELIPIRASHLLTLKGYNFNGTPSGLWLGIARAHHFIGNICTQFVLPPDWEYVDRGSC